MLAARTYLVEYRPVCLSGERCRPTRTEPAELTRMVAHELVWCLTIKFN